MPIALISISDYVLDPSLLKISEDDFYTIHVKLRNQDAKKEHVEMDNVKFNEVFSNLSHQFGGMYFALDYKSFSTKITSDLMRAISGAETMKQLMYSIDRHIDTEKGMIEDVSLKFDRDTYKKAESEAKEKKASLKKAFLNDLFSDSGIADNEHNRLICEKAWTVTCNTDYHGEYMSESFYYKVESWFRELKDLASDLVVKSDKPKIQFYDKETGRVLENTDDYYFVMNDLVYCDNDFSTESQEASVSFDEFIKECPAIGWRMI